MTWTTLRVQLASSQPCMLDEHSFCRPARNEMHREARASGLPGELCRKIPRASRSGSAKIANAVQTKSQCPWTAWFDEKSIPGRSI